MIRKFLCIILLFSAYSAQAAQYEQKNDEQPTNYAQLRKDIHFLHHVKKEVLRITQLRQTADIKKTMRYLEKEVEEYLDDDVYGQTYLDVFPHVALWEGQWDSCMPQQMHEKIESKLCSYKIVGNSMHEYLNEKETTLQKMLNPYWQRKKTSKDRKKLREQSGYIPLALMDK